MSMEISSKLPTDLLEEQAEEQRRRIHNAVTTLRAQVRETVHEKLDPRKQARDHLWPLAGAAFLFSFFFGYGTAGTIKHFMS
jgi:hypothetical protein